MLTDILSALGGVSVILTALIAYLGKTRLEALKNDLAATNEKLRAALAHSVHVTQAQFDLELDIYKKLWAELFPVRMRTYALRPMLDQVDANEPEQERIRRRLKEFGEAYNCASAFLEQNRPFVPVAIYAAFRDILTLCHEEAVEFEHSSPLERKEYWQTARKNQEKMTVLFDTACDAIQRRLGSASIVA